MLSLLYSLLLCNQLSAAVSTISTVAVNENDVFNFDFTWTPLRPRANETVHFKAVGLGHSSIQRWGLTNASFRWYRQLPSADFRLVHVGRRYSRTASGDYFEGRYRLSVKVNSPHQSDSQSPTSWSRVDIIKYVGLQRRIHSALLVQNRTDNRPGRRLVCRYWGYPRVESLQFQAPRTSSSRDGLPICRTAGHFETAESEPYIDLVSDCTINRLPPGEYSCYGRNAAGASRLKCRLTEDKAELLGKMTNCQEIVAEEVSVAAKSRKDFRQLVGNESFKRESVGMATVVSLLVTAMSVSIM